MTATAAPTARDGAGPLGRGIQFACLALLAYVPFLLSSPGQVSGDTKQFLSIDPGRLLERASYLWDAHTGVGTVTHQHIGYLVPMGPFFWLFDTLGVPAWVTQRLWLGTLSLAAVLGARWLLRLLGASRAGALAGALVYMLTPYQLAFTARSSVLLLPWAGLPLLVALTIRAERRAAAGAVGWERWREPALFALVVFVIAGTNATSLLFVLLAPGLWLLLRAIDATKIDGRAAARNAIGTGVRLAVPAIGVSLWWAVGLRTQGTYGLPILQLTETLRTSQGSSLPSDLLRGLGNWFFYGGDRLGFSIDQTADYANTRWIIAASFAIPIVALATAAVIKWRYRAYFALLIVVGTVVGVGSWPFDDPSPYGRLFKALAEGSSAVLALRNTPRVVPIIVLGVAGILAAGVTALAARRVQVVAAAVVIAMAVVALAPVLKDGFLSERILRDEAIPQYWQDAADALEAQGSDTRVFEIPGANFAAYRWGNTVEPVTPALMNRPWVAREVLPYGTAESVNLVNAIDHRIQEGTLEPDALARVARILGIGTILLRSDLEYERFDTPRPRALWAALTEPVPDGLDAPIPYGPPRPNVATDALPMLDELELRTAIGTDDPPPVALFDVQDAVNIVHTAPTDQPVVLAGDGEGIVDAAAAGLLDGNQLVLELASLSRSELRAALEHSADLVLTDTNRRRAETFFASVRDTTGATERAGEQPLRDDDNDQRLPALPGTGDDARTVAEQSDRAPFGATVDATSYGDRDRYTPEDRPVHAVDGDLRTAWRTNAGAGEWLVIRPSAPVRADRVTLVQPQSGDRVRTLTQVRLRFDDGDPVTVDLGPESLTPDGQVVRFPERAIRRLEVEPLTTTTGPLANPSTDQVGANPVGFAEVVLDDVRTTETIRLPVDLARRIGDDADGHRLDVVLTRLRTEPADRERQDQEVALSRRFVLPDARTFGLAGTARIAPNAPDATLDVVLGTTAPGATFTTSGHLAGDTDARASRAFDADPATAWVAPMGTQEGQSLTVDLAAPITVDHADLVLVADGRHSVPTQLRLDVDGEPARTITVPAVADAAEPGATRTVPVTFEPVTGRQLRLVVEAVRPITTIDDRTRAAIALPVAIAETGLAGVPVPAAPADVPDPCRGDLLRVDGDAVPVRVVGSSADIRTGLALESCGEALALDAGSHTLRSVPGLDTGIDVDRVVLSSDAAGAPAAVAPLGAPLAESGAEVRVVDEGEASFDLTVRTDGAPFWLVLGQSQSDGWEAETGDGESLGTSRLVDGYANGWLVDPGDAGVMTITLRWTPQGIVWIGMAISALVVLACLGIVFLTRRRATVALAFAPSLTSPVRYSTPAPRLGVALGTAVVAALGAAAISRWWIGVIAGVAALLTAWVVAGRVNAGRVLLAAGAPLALALSKAVGEPELGWLAVALLATDLLVGWARQRWRSRARS